MFATSSSGRPSAFELHLAVPPDDGVFSDAEVEGCDEPVRRYFKAAIAPGTPLACAARLRMHGAIRFGKRWFPFRAEELLAPLHGYLWPATVAHGLLRGSDCYDDGLASMSWKLLGIVPVIRSTGADVARSARGRTTAEGVWLPTAVLPRYGVQWHAKNDRHIVATIPIEGEQQTLCITTDDAGLVRSVHVDRWGDPDGTGQFDWYPFGIEIARSRSFHVGITMGAEGIGGWFHATDRWREGAFFRYTIRELAPIR
jgi:hypothetical protein